MLLEQLYRPAGIRFETPYHDVATHLHMRRLVFSLDTLGIIKIEVNGGGNIPKKGPGILVLNHISHYDIVIPHYLAGKYAGRTISCVARRSLVDPDVKESPRAIARRTKGGLLNSSGDSQDSWMKTQARKIIGEFIKKFNPILADPSSPNFDFLEAVKAELDAGRLVGVFPQGTRAPKLDLLDTQIGVALIILQNPNVPIVPIGVSGTNRSFFRFRVRPVINIGNSFTLADIDLSGLHTEKEYRKKVASYVADRIGELVDDKTVIPAWRLAKMGLSRGEIQKLSKNGGLPLSVEKLESLGRYII